jgi:hypothetical protein
MRTIAGIHMPARRSEGVRLGVVLEGLAALVALVAFVGAFFGAVTWALVRLVTLLAS